MIARIIVRFTKRGDSVLDMFAGTGSAALGCIMTDRKYMGCDEDSNVVAAAQLRIGRLLCAMDKAGGRDARSGYFGLGTTADLLRIAHQPLSATIIGRDNIPPDACDNAADELARLGLPLEVSHTRSSVHAHSQAHVHTTDTHTLSNHACI